MSNIEFTKNIENKQVVDLEKIPAAVWKQLVSISQTIRSAKAMGFPYDSTTREALFSCVEDGEGLYEDSLWGSCAEARIDVPELRDFSTQEEWEAAFLSYKETLTAGRRACITYERVLADAKAIFPEVDDEDLRPYVEKEAARRAVALWKDVAREEEEYAGAVASKEARKVRISRDKTMRPFNVAGRVLEDRRFDIVYNRTLRELRGFHTVGAWNILSSRYSSRGPRSASRRPSRTAVGASSPGGGGSPGDDSGGSEPPQGDPDLPSRPLIGGYLLVFPSQPESILPSWRPRCPGPMSHALLRGWSR